MSKESGQLKREITSRQLTRITLGGGIGTGIFLASGALINEAGPGGAVVAYACVALIVYFVMTCLAEMTSHMPVSGAYAAQAARFVDPAFGFSVGWNSWFGWAVTIAVEVEAGAILMGFWFPHVPSIVWSALLLTSIIGVNLVGAKGYGVSEYWFATIKIGSVVMVSIVGLLMMVGLLGGEAIGLSNFSHGDAPFVGGIKGTFSVFTVAGFALIGSEMFAITAGEVKDAEKNIPKAVKTIVWRLILFYVVAVFVLGCCVPYDDPNLLNTDLDHVAMSPFAILLMRAGIPVGAHVISFVVLIAVISQTNSSLFLTSRMLYSMAETGKAPKFFAKKSRHGVPVAAILSSGAIGMLCFLSSLVGSGQIYLALLNVSALNGFLMWLTVAICYYRFRKGFLFQGNRLESLEYAAKGYPYNAMIAIFGCFVIIFGQLIAMFLQETRDWFSISTMLFCLVVYILPYFIYKGVYKTKIISYGEIDYANKSTSF